MCYDVAVIGGGPAGLSAALSAQSAGASVLLIERDVRLGGILPQCIHTGFGLYRWKKELTGPEYAQADIDALEKTSVTCYLGTFVTGLRKAGDLCILETSRRGSIGQVKARSAVLAMGCRERTAGAVSLPGSRPAGIFTAGTAQRLMNMQNLRLGNRAVIIGSGDIGLIMARRLVLEGTDVAAVTEIMDYPGGLARNVHQCLEDYDIPLHVSTPIEEIIGRERVEAVRIPGRIIPCDTVLLSVGLIPENELTRDASIPLDPRTGGAVTDENCMTATGGIFACGNVLHVHDVADFASREAHTAGRAAAAWARGDRPERQAVSVLCSEEIRYARPQLLSSPGRALISLRLKEPMNSFSLVIRQGKEILMRNRYLKVMPSEMLHFEVQVSSPLPVEVSCE